MINYLMQTSPLNSRTWVVHVRFLAQRYGLDDPIEYLILDPPSRQAFKEFVETKIYAYYEKELREKAQNNSRMTYSNNETMMLFKMY